MEHGKGSSKRGHSHDDDHDEEHEEHGEPWLVSYADLMTLLFGFFVLMYTFASKEDSSEYVKVKKEFSKYFGKTVTGKTDTEKDIEEIKKLLEGSSMKSEFEVVEISNGLEIILRSGLMFKIGNSDIEESKKAILFELVAFLKEKMNRIFIEIEGHTDDSPISSARFPSNWELSGGRAAAVLRVFHERGFPAKQVRGIFYGDQRPTVPNRDDQGVRISANQAKNRRVVIRILNLGLVEKTAPVK